ncbi:MAG TPA: hypothetical protein VMT42_02585 [candidate division Zixibacteria bacterium]|nr:hypothetical protein [candidate division Zixibacteria bacterium]
MPTATEILNIVKPHFTVRVYENMLRIDLKGSIKNDIEEAFENKPVLKQTIGSILEMFIPLHVHLSDIDSVNKDKRGSVMVKLPQRRDIILPLGPRDAKRLADKLNQLIPRAKDKELKRLMKEHKLQRIEKIERELAEEKLSFPLGGAQPPVPQPSGVLEKEKRAAREREN